MSKSTKIWSYLLASVFLILFIGIPLTFAQSDFGPPTLLPGDDTYIGGYGDICVGLVEGIRTGDISLRQTPCFIKYFSEVLIGIAGTLAVIFVMVGGYRYVVGGDEDKDAAKKTITYALIGLVVTLLAWVMVDIVLQFATE
ncbi:pilin [Patescibacteria group bacterium]|nr:pilin [Patescibacteria group bacterium]MBU1683253.1 pilin [Patescibacteria group bacterium]MBU1935602.1 pilin [Patescibacteria group bacterium]